jgi:gluconate 2-dehydrogenase gamma chain
MADSQDRRAFLKSLGAVGAAGVAAIVPAEAVEAAQAPAAAPAASPADAAPPPYAFFTPPEAAFVEAAAARLIPADDLTPSGTDCGVPTYIDRQLAGAWGSGHRLYLQGPWQKGTPTQGYQLPMTPAELFRAGISATNAYCRQTFQREFDRLTADQQDTVLRGLEQGQLAIAQVPALEFFNLLLQMSMEGFFADPIYGGNRNKASWKVLGYPGVIAIHGENIKAYRNRRFTAEPTSIEDLS